MAATAMLVGIARYFRNCGGDARLILRVEADQFGKASRPTANQHDVRLGGDRDL